MIRIIDARMGRGKTTAAIRYMNENIGDKRFIYATPYLSEVERISKACNFCAPEDSYMSKLTSLKVLANSGHNITTTHSLFLRLDEEAINLIADKGYTLVVDEEIKTIEKLDITNKDKEIILSKSKVDEESGKITLIDTEYTGKLEEYMELAKADSLYLKNNQILYAMNPKILRAFEDIFMLTYMFEGQYQSMYLKANGFEYSVAGITVDGAGYKFSDKKDCPPPVDFSQLIEIVENEKWNAPGDRRNALSKHWYEQRNESDKDIRKIRSSMHRFFSEENIEKAERMFTCFKGHEQKLIYRRRYKKEFVPVNTRATNDYRNCSRLVYAVNRFANPILADYYKDLGFKIDDDLFALSEMVQWIWRSAIRDGEPIKIYIPSRRMREMLKKWIQDLNQPTAEDVINEVGGQSTAENENVEMLPDVATE